MLKKVLLAIVVLLGLFAVVVASQPAAFRVERSATIPAPASVVFAQVNDFHKWDAWSPWAKLDPAMKATHSGAAAGPGAIYHWEGNKDVGEGRMTITESRPNEMVRIKLDFIKPFESTNLTEFVFKPSSNQTAVTWTMTGEKSFISKAVCLFMDMDKMVGGDFEKGLAAMQTAAVAAGK